MAALMQAVKEEAAIASSAALSASRRTLATETTHVAARTVRQEAIALKTSISEVSTSTTSAIPPPSSLLTNTIAEDLSLTIREHISQSSGQGLEELGDFLQKNRGAIPSTTAGPVTKELLSNAPSGTTA